MEQDIIGDDHEAKLIELLCFKMTKQFEKDRILRLIFLLSITEGGLKEATYKLIIKTYVECYGIEDLHVLLGAEDMGIFRKKSGKFDWKKIRDDF